MITQQQEDDIYNALLVGMAMDDAYVFAGLSPRQMVEISEDQEKQLMFRRLTRQLEFSLLDNMVTTSKRQMSQGKCDATTWLLEKLYPRYKGVATDNSGKIEIICNKSEHIDDIRDIHVSKGKK
jgi:hypothetical protein